MAGLRHRHHDQLLVLAVVVVVVLSSFVHLHFVDGRRATTLLASNLHIHRHGRRRLPTPSPYSVPSALLSLRGGGAAAASSKNKKSRVAVGAFKKKNKKSEAAAPAGGGNASMAASVFNLVNNVAGAGILALSAGMASGTGWVPAVLVCVLLGVISTHTFAIVGEACDLASCSDFKVRAFSC